MPKHEDQVETTVDGGDVEVHESENVSRRGFLKGIGGTGAAAAAASLGLGSTLVAPESAEAEVIGPAGPVQRRLQAYGVRRNAARAYLLEPPLGLQDCNGDEALYADLRATFSKALPHDNLGEVDLGAYQSLRDALESGDPADFNLVPLSPVADRKLANPQAAYTFEMTGRDSHATRMQPAPAFASALQSAEMGEVYWQALTRDVPFRNYVSDPTIAAAVADLNGFSETVGPKVGGLVTPGTIFRGETPGDLAGPYISQFLWQEVPFGLAKIDQRYNFPQPGIDFMTDYAEWLAIQRGSAPTTPITFDPTPRYIYSARAMGEYVHVDVTFQSYLNAALIMFSYGPAALDPNNPYLTSPNQGGFVTFGLADIADLVTKAANVALKGAWWQKWLVHRRLRPEVMAGRIENQLNGSKNYGIDAEILSSNAVANLQSANGNALLPMAFPEGSPTHPSYPAGHATNAGACATILKAFFNEDFVIPNPVEASADGLSLDPWAGAPLTLGGEINKLANNISLGRDAAGVHYRSDGIDGVSVGEQQAIGVLADYSRGYNEDFAGFSLHRFDGQELLIVDGEVHEV